MGPSSRQFFIFGFMVFAPYVLPEHFTLVFLIFLIYTQSPAPTSHHCCHGHSNCHYKIIRKKRRLGVIHHRHRNKTVKIFTTSSLSKVGQRTTESTVPLLVKSSGIKPSTELPVQSTPRSNGHTHSPRCLWCDSYGHLQDGCKELADAINTGKVLYRSNRIVNAITGKEFAPRI